MIDRSEAAGARRILYFGDPMCSWCYGFAPAVRRIEQTFGRRAPIRLVMGGLRAGTTEPMTDAAKARMRGHWDRVREATGQPFVFGLFEREGFVYDTEPACRAVVAARTLSPAAALAYFREVQRAFYAEGRDTTDAGALIAIAAECGIDATAFGSALRSEQMAAATGADFRLSRQLGVHEFPSLVLQDGTRYAYLTVGYRPFEELAPTLHGWLAADA
jgi:putative protein-disulfide isomerase